jgi:antitoxin CptB
MPETPQARLGRLRLRSMRRGLREMDLILQDFAARELLAMPPSDLDAYEALLEEPDPDLLAWVTGAAPAPRRHEALVARIRAGAVGLWRPD